MSWGLLLSILIVNYDTHYRQTRETGMENAARRLFLFGIAVTALLVLAACGSEEPNPTTAPVAQSTLTPIVTGNDGQGGDIAVVTVTGTEYSFDAPGTIAAGRTTLRFTNEGQEAHELQLMRFNEGVLIHQFMGTLHQGGGLEEALQMVSETGGVERTEPGQTAEATVDLPEGEYLLVSLVENNGVADVLKGMAKPLTVTAAP